MYSEQNLIWIDLEMTGLDTDNDLIIEMATIVTDSQLNILAEGPVLAIHQSDEVLAVASSISLLKVLCWRFTSLMKCWRVWTSGIPVSTVAVV